MIHDCVELQNKLIRISIWRYSLLCDIIYNLSISAVVFIVRIISRCAIDSYVLCISYVLRFV